MIDVKGIPSTIQELKKGNRFIFNHETYTVKRKWIDDDGPLVAFNEDTKDTHRFSWEGLEIDKLT